MSLIKDIVWRLSMRNASWRDGNYRFALLPTDIIGDGGVEALYAAHARVSKRTGVDVQSVIGDAEYKLVYYVVHRGVNGENGVLLVEPDFGGRWVPGLSREDLPVDARERYTVAARELVDALEGRVCESVRDEICDLEDEDLVPDAEERENMFAIAKGELNGLLRDGVPPFTMPPLVAESPTSLGLRYAVDPEKTYKRWRAEKGIDYRVAAKRALLRYRYRTRVLEEAKANATPSLTRAMAIANVLKESREAGRKLLRVYFEASDADIPKWISARHPDFRLGEKAVCEAKVAAAGNSFTLEEGFPYYSVEFVSPRIKDGRNLEAFVDRIRPDMVKEIVYGQKVLYDKKNYV